MGDEIDHEAADEITRLRADLEKWRQASDMFLTSAEAAEAERDRMKAALDGCTCPNCVAAKEARR